MNFNVLEHDDSDDNAHFHIIGYIISWSSVFMNPIIYVISNKYYRKTVLKTFGCNTNGPSEMYYNDTLYLTPKLRRTLPDNELRTRFQSGFYE